MALSQEVTSALMELVNCGFKDHLYDTFLSLLKDHLSDLEDAEYSAKLQSAVTLYLDMAAHCYQPYTSDRPMLISDPGMKEARPSFDFVRHSLLIGAVHFGRLVRECHRTPQHVEMALGAAVSRDMHRYVVWFCVETSKMKMLPVILGNVLWTYDHQHVRFMTTCDVPTSWLAHNSAAHYLRKTLAAPQSWERLSELSCLAPTLQKSIEAGFFPTMTRDEKSALPAVVGHCLDGSEWWLAVCLPLLLDHWGLIRRVIIRLPREAKERHFQLIVSCLKRQRRVSCEKAVEILINLLQDSWTNILAFSSTSFPVRKLCHMAAMCEKQRRDKWLVLVMIHLNNWPWVKNFTTSSKDTGVVDMTLVHAAKTEQWDIVEVLLPRSSKAKDLIGHVFNMAVDQIRPAAVEQILPLVQQEELNAGQKILMLGLSPDAHEEIIRRWSLLASNQKPRLVHIMLLILQRAAALNLVNLVRVLTQVMVAKLPSGVRMLLRSGLVSPSQCREVLNNPAVREVMDNDDEFRHQVLDCVRRVERAGTMRLGEVVFFK